jgi:hypothetical protein
MIREEIGGKNGLNRLFFPRKAEVDFPEEKHDSKPFSVGFWPVELPAIADEKHSIF